MLHLPALLGIAETVTHLGPQYNARTTNAMMGEDKMGQSAVGLNVEPWCRRGFSRYYPVKRTQGSSSPVTFTVFSASDLQNYNTVAQTENAQASNFKVGCSL